ncbi:hypothetical protein [Agarivorans sp. Toyoura001]|uniref:hypothetical protein n=1 Tax=unclassified Agarivorans TaxID=2636026 RepID=UPI0010EAB61E|nr:hypothetical protein [Agarivorans sp. Toyoura001]GDY25324.1 hypothetical protein AHAT_12140 [Agarivorans sp. Toyoura001]
MNILKLTMIMAISTALFACASQSQQMQEQGYPVDYADGFEDGCHSGHQAGGSLFDQFKKDINRFEQQKQYAQGWSDGFRQCESQEEALQRQTRIAIEQQKLEQQRQDDIAHQALKDIDTSGLKGL